MKVAALAGGTGSAKLLVGLAASPVDLSVIANVGDNAWIHGLYVCPDIDTPMYALSGVADTARGWGLAGDTFRTLGQLGQLGEETWFKIGDLDMATHILRTSMLRGGHTLTEVTSKLCSAFGVGPRILPVTDEEVPTHIITESGELHLQDFWVRLKGRPRVRGVRYLGAERSRISKDARRAIETADLIVFCPGNPVTSIGPILSVGGLKDALRLSAAGKVAVSPMVGRAPFSGPAGKLLKAVGVRSDLVGVAQLYSGLIDTMVVDSGDSALAQEIERSGARCIGTSTRMPDLRASKKLAAKVLTLR